MPISLTCDCGARFEVEDGLAGREVGCPECQAPLAVPASPSAPPRTSGLALASTILALVGAFTVLGTVAAVVVGVLALSAIARDRQRLTGTGFALFGIVAGIAFTALTLFALGTNELFGLGGYVRERAMAGRVDTSGPLAVSGTDWTITRPSEKWGRVQGDRSDDPAVWDLQASRDLLLMNLAQHAYIDVHKEANPHPQTLDWQLDTTFKQEFTGQGGAEQDRPPMRLAPPRRLSDRRLPESGTAEGHEAIYTGRRGGQRWTFIVRAYRRLKDGPQGGGPVYFVRAYAPTRRFKDLEDELRKALDSFRIDR
jgi:hypothetical protein